MSIKAKNLFVNFIQSFMGFFIPMSILFFLLYRNFEKAFILGILASSIFAFGIVLFILIEKIFMLPYYNEFIKNNKVIYNSPANLFKDKYSIGGWMFITDDLIFFHPHKINFDLSDFKINFNEIASVEISKMINCIIIKTNDGKSIKFSINNRKSIIKIIESKLKKGKN